MTEKTFDPLDLSLRELIARLLEAHAVAPDPDRWIDTRDPQQCPVRWRSVLDAARRGELEVSRVGRQVLVRASELDRWLAANRIEPRAAQPAAVSPERSRAAHTLERAGYVPSTRTKP